MYTFILSCIGMFLLSGIIFKKKIKERQFAVYTIILVGSLIISTIVNGIYGLPVPYTKVLHKEKELEDKYTCSVIENNDTLMLLESYIDFDYITDSTGAVNDNSILIGRINEKFNIEDSNKINFVLTEDSIPRVRVYKYRRIIENPWVTSFGLPSSSRKEYTICLHKNKDNIKLVEFINKKYYSNEKI